MWRWGRGPHGRAQAERIELSRLYEKARGRWTDVDPPSGRWASDHGAHHGESAEFEREVWISRRGRGCRVSGMSASGGSTCSRSRFPNPMGGAAPNECADPASSSVSQRQRVSSGEDGANGGRVVASGEMGSVTTTRCGRPDLPWSSSGGTAPQESRVQRRALSLKYTPCWAAMITVTEPLNGQLDGYACDHPVAAWIAHDSSKPGRPLPGRWVVHAQAEWSAANEEASPADVAHALSAAFTEVVKLGVSEVQVHRWRYALAEPTGASTMMFEEDLGLGLCGDGLAGGKVEGAWQSAIDLVSHMNDRRG